MCVSCECRVCCQLEIFATGLSLLQKSPIECGASECDRPNSMRRPKPTTAVEPRKKKTFSTENEEYNIPFLIILSTLSTRSGEHYILRCVLVAQSVEHYRRSYSSTQFTTMFTRFYDKCLPSLILI